MKLALLLVVGLLCSAIPAFAADIEPDAGTTVNDYTFELLDTGTFVSFGENYFAGAGAFHGSHVNFTDTSLEAADNPTQTFGIGVEDGNATISIIDSGAAAVMLTMDCAATCYPIFYYSDPVYGVQVITGGTVTSIHDADFYTNEAQFDAAAAPAVYETGEFVKVKLTYQDPSTVTFFLDYDGAGTYIYVDMARERIIQALTLNHPNATAIPASIDLYSSNNPNAWGSVDKALTLEQSTGAQEYLVESDFSIAGRYLKLQVNDFGSALLWEVSEIDIEVVDTNSKAYEVTRSINDNTYLVITIAGYGLVVTAVSLIFGRASNRV